MHKRTEVIVKGPDGNQFKLTKCVPQVLLELADNADGQWQFVGVLPMFDPPR